MTVLIMFEGGMYYYKSAYLPSIVSSANSQTNNLLVQISDKDQLLNDSLAQITNLQKLKSGYESSLKNLEGKVAGLSTTSQSIQIVQTSSYPFSVPTNGNVGTFAGTWGGNMYGKTHYGVDIWTTLSNDGMVAGDKGNPVYSACDGKVTRISPAEGAVTVLCNSIPHTYLLPAYDGVFTYYGHMASGVTKQLYIVINEQQTVTKSQLLGYQGDLSVETPQMRNVHLHFAVYSGQYLVSAGVGGPYNPCIYIGGDCTKPGSKFQAGN